MARLVMARLIMTGLVMPGLVMTPRLLPLLPPTSGMLETITDKADTLFEPLERRHHRHHMLG